jgi:hypothetical protein
MAAGADGLAGGPSSFFGVVIDPDGKPVAGAKVALFPNSGRPLPESIGSGVTGSDGRFSFTAAVTSSNSPMIEAEAPGFTSTSISPVVPDDEIWIQLGWSIVLFGVVRHARSGLPLSGVELTKWCGV